MKNGTMKIDKHDSEDYLDPDSFVPLISEKPRIPIRQIIRENYYDGIFTGFLIGFFIGGVLALIIRELVGKGIL